MLHLDTTSQFDSVGGFFMLQDCFKMCFRRTRHFKQRILFLTTLLGLIWIFTYDARVPDAPIPIEIDSSVWLPRNWYAVFACSTPYQNSHRGYDYAFYLPLTVLAWERIGFKSVVQIIGTRSEWQQNRLLAWVLESLKSTDATVIFLDATKDHRTSLAQTARLFVVNMDAFPGSADDYVITTDADLWPLNPHHYTPKPDANLVLVHSYCCGFFEYNGRKYRMYPMSNIGATSKIWNEIMNENQIFANDSQTILQYLENYFGKRVRDELVFASNNWFMDQHLVSIRIEHWMQSRGNSSVFRMSDEGFSRFDRINRIDWNERLRHAESSLFYENTYDAHLLEDPFDPSNWVALLELLILMFGDDDWRILWSQKYATVFLDIYREINAL